MTQLVGLIDAHPVNDLAPVLGHHMEQVADDLSLSAMGFDLQLIRVANTTDPRSQSCAIWQQLFASAPTMARDTTVRHSKRFSAG